MCLRKRNEQRKKETKELLRTNKLRKMLKITVCNAFAMAGESIFWKLNKWNNFLQHAGKIIVQELGRELCASLWKVLRTYIYITRYVTDFLFSRRAYYFCAILMFSIATLNIYIYIIRITNKNLFYYFIIHSASFDVIRCGGQRNGIEIETHLQCACNTYQSQRTIDFVQLFIELCDNVHSAHRPTPLMLLRLTHFNANKNL